MCETRWQGTYLRTGRMTSSIQFRTMKIVAVFCVIWVLTVSLAIAKKKRSASANLIESKTHLETVHVVFRHGDRTPERSYPTDIYTKEDYAPIGFSQLTNAGKLRAYNLGKIIKSTYGAFLGESYYPDIVDSISSHSPRCKTSLLAVLAGLFPPQGNEIWTNEIAWQPIPFNAFTSSENRMFAPFGSCPQYSTLVATAMEGIYQDPGFTNFSNTFDYILTNAGMTGNIGYAVDVLYSTLKSQQEFGLALPSWTDSVWPEPISTMQGHGFKYLALNDQLKSIAAGYLTKQIIENALNTQVSGRKIYLYSGHDANIVSLLMMMDNFVPHCPNYSAYITFEVHNISGTRYLKISYNNYESASPKTLSLSCGTYCTIDQFASLYSKYTNTTATDGLCGSW